MRKKITGFVSKLAGSTGRQRGIHLCFLIVIVLFYIIRALFYDLNDVRIDTGFYERSMISESEVNIENSAVLDELYIKVLSGLFALFGNKVSIVLSFQFFIAGVSLLISITAIRKIWGRLVSVTAGLILTGTPFFVNQLFSVNPGVVYYSLWSIGLLLSAIYIKRVKGDKLENDGMIGFGIMGFLSGVLFAVYPPGIILILLLAYYGTRRKKSRVIYLGFCTLLGGLCIWNFRLFAEITELMEQMWLWLGVDKDNPVITVNTIIENYLVWGVLLIGVILGILLKKFLYGDWQAENDEGLWLREEEIMEQELQKKENISENDEKPTGMRMSALLNNSGTLVNEKKKRQKPKKKESRNKEKPVKEKKVNDDSTSRYDDSKGISYIKNPLPLPKKPQMKGMDFLENLPEGELEFDIDIAEDDDFDL